MQDQLETLKRVLLSEKQLKFLSMQRCHRFIENGATSSSSSSADGSDTIASLFDGGSTGEGQGAPVHYRSGCLESGLFECDPFE